jgi:D-amino-acid oxidase
MSTEQLDCVVIGAGVVGLACARALALAGHEVWLLEREAGFGNGISSRSSAVIHAGLYYPPGSLKASMCVRGQALLYAYCAERGVPHRRCGKLLVAGDAAEVEQLEAIRRSAEANGVTTLQPLGAAEATRLEPELACAGAMLSPDTGIVDSHALMLSLLGDAQALGAQWVPHAEVCGADCDRNGLVLEVVSGGEPMRLATRHVVNATGLEAPALARRIAGLPPAAVPQAFFAKGSYFRLAGRTPFSHLVYPVPEAAGLGVHLTLDLAGRARFGPDVEWMARPDYAVDPARAARFYPAIRRYWPGLPDGALQADYAGVRPKIVCAGQAAADFRIDGPAAHGQAGLVNLFGIESPGLTSCLAIGEHVTAMLAPG